MRSFRAAFAALVAALAGAVIIASVQAVAAPACAPTPGDMLGPFYRPDAPVRSSVGKGHVLRGTVRSSADCGAIPGARVELWPQGLRHQQRRMPEPDRWTDDGERALLNVVSRGQGFVLDADEYPEAIDWIRFLLAS